MKIPRELRLLRLPSPLTPRIAFVHVFVVLPLLALSLLMAGMATGQSPQPDIEAGFRAGQAALRQGDFPRAVEQFKRVLALDPTLVEAKVNLGLAYQSLLDYDAAARNLAPALRERPNL